MIREKERQNKRKRQEKETRERDKRKRQKKETKERDKRKRQKKKEKRKEKNKREKEKKKGKEKTKREKKREKKERETIVRKKERKKGRKENKERLVLHLPSLGWFRYFPPLSFRVVLLSHASPYISKGGINLDSRTREALIWTAELVDLIDAQDGGTRNVGSSMLVRVGCALRLELILSSSSFCVCFSHFLYITLPHNEKTCLSLIPRSNGEQIVRSTSALIVCF